MRRLHRYCLQRQQPKMSWNPINCFNITLRKPLNDRHLNLFQYQWKSKALCRLYFNGDVTERCFLRAFNLEKRDIYRTLSYMERRVDNILFRSLFCSSVFQARKLASSGQVLVNGKRILRPGHILEAGDLLQIAPSSRPQVLRSALHPMIRLWAFLPRYLEVDYSTLSLVLVKQPSFKDIPSPFPKQMIDAMGAFYSKRG